jgi:hypothetical protein
MPWRSLIPPRRDDLVVIVVAILGLALGAIVVALWPG